MKKETWKKVGFDKIYNKAKEKAIRFTKEKAIGFYPAFLVYSLTLIVLLKLSQILLGWNF